MVVVDLILKLSLLIAVSVLSGFILTRWKRESHTGIILQGVLFGTVALTGMLNPFVLSPGIIFDGRSVILSLCALFFGPVTGLIATLMALLYRIYLGGDGIITGISVILSSYLIGSIYYYKRRKIRKPLTVYRLYVFGLLVHMAMLMLMAAFPSPARALAYKTMSFTILGIFPLATLLIGKILSDQQNNAELLTDRAEGELRFHMLVKNMNQGLAVHEIICNSEGIPIDYRFIYMNEKYEQITGFRRQDFVGKTILEVLPDTPERTIKKYGEVALTGKPFHFESFSREKKIYYEADIYQPSYHQFAVIISDITVRKQAEREIITKNKTLEKLIAEKDKLFSIVSHDLRSPMNGIIGLTGMIKDETESFSKEHIKEIATSIHTSASSIIQLLHGLLEWSKFQRGSFHFNPHNELLLVAVQKCINVLNENAKAKQISIHCTIPENISVFADKQMLESIIRNLISNAIKFTPAGGHIQIAASVTDPLNTAITVSDDGIGMSPDLLGKLFSLSAKINRKGTEGELSSGLGLILIKELIEKHGGKIWAESTEGKGSTFHFLLKTSSSEP